MNPISFVNWGGSSTGTIQEPDDYASNQDAAAIGLTGWPYGSTMLGIASEWNDINISNSLYYIIEYDFINESRETRYPQIQCSSNPCRDYIKVGFGAIPSLITVYDTKGVKVYGTSELMTGNQLVITKDFPKGLYLLVVEKQNGSRENIKFIRE